MADSLRNLSKDELIEIVENLQRNLEDDENELARLTQENEQLSRRKGSKDVDPTFAEISEYIAQIDDLRANQEQDQIELTNLREQLAESKTRVVLLQSEKVDLESRVKIQSKRIEELEIELLNASSLTRSALQQSQEISKIRSDSNKETISLLQDIEILQEKNRELEGTIKDMTQRNELLEEAMQNLAEEKEDILTHSENAELATKEMEDRLKLLENMIDQAQQKLNNAEDAQARIQQEKDVSTIDYERRLRYLNEQLVAKTSEIDALQRQLTAVSQSSDNLLKPSDRPKQATDYAILVEELQQELQTTIDQRDKLAERILITEDNIERIVSQRVVSEREKVLHLEKQIELLKLRIEDINQNRELDNEKSRLLTEIDELSNWKAVYEAGHGMQELARTTKKLRDHNRRLETAIEQMNSKLGVVLDANGILELAFDKLKIEAGKDQTFHYPEYQLKDEMLTEKAKLNAQLKELEDQVNSLETDNIRLRKALKEKAGSLGEKNLESLKDENLDLLVASRSTDLIMANRKLKDDLRLLTLQLQHYERQPMTNSAILPVTNETTSKEILVLREDIQKLFNYLRLKSNTHLDEDVTENISAILLSHNEALIKEIKELQKIQMRHEEAIRRSTLSNKQPSSSNQDIVLQSSVNNVPVSKIIKIDNDGPAAPFEEMKSSTDITVPIVSNSYRIPAIPSSLKPSDRRWDETVSMEIDSNKIEPSVQPVMRPSTSQGNALLHRNLKQLNLPAEEWSQDIRNLYSQYIECLEQLYEREQEIEDQQQIITSFEDHLIAIKQQTSILYHDHIRKLTSWEQREKEYQELTKQLRNENDDYKLKFKRFNELLDIKHHGTIESLESKLNELTRKLATYEVNENILSRRYIAQSEQLANEQELRRKLELDMIDMEGTLKKRILYLEQYKAAMSSRLGYLQLKLDESVPSQDYLIIQSELEQLREDHLNTLEREVNIRLTALTSHETVHELRILRQRVIELESQHVHDHQYVIKLQSELLHEQELNKKLANKSISADTTSIISELAKYRGETARLEVELLASNKKCELLINQLTLLSKENDTIRQQLTETTSKYEEIISNQELINQEYTSLRLTYEHGLTKDESDQLRSKIDKLTLQNDEIQRENIKLKEIAEISLKQAQTMSQLRDDHLNTIKELQEQCLRLESRGDDDILIGKLQRQLMSTKVSYKAFVRKYQILQSNINQRELAIRMLETRLDQREDMIMKLQESYRFEINSLKQALRQSSQTIHDKKNPTQPNQDVDKSNIQVFSKKSKQKKMINVQLKMNSLTNSIKQLTLLTEKSIERKLIKDQENQQYQQMVSELTCEKNILEQKLIDLDSLLHNQSKHSSIASRIITLTDEIKETKLINLQLNRQIKLLTHEKKYYQSMIHTIQVDIENLEELQLKNELKHHFKYFLESQKNELSFGMIESLTNHNTNSNDNQVGIERFYKKVGFRSLLNDQPSEPMESIASNHNQSNQQHHKNSSINEEDQLLQLDELKKQLLVCQRELTSKTITISSLESQCQSIQSQLKEKTNQISYYEQVIESNGLPLLSGQSNRNRSQSVNRNQTNQMTIAEHEKLQEAATATIHSLRSLIEDKNQMIEKLQIKINELRNERLRKKSRADQTADELLDRLQYEQSHDLNQPMNPSSNPSDLSITSNMNQRLNEQLNQAEQLINEKSLLIINLEEKLVTLTNQKERAEIRCGECLKEMEYMKQDMINLTKQLQSNEEKLKYTMTNPLSTDQSSLIRKGKPVPSPPTPTNDNDPQENNRLQDNNQLLVYEKKIKEYIKQLQLKNDKIKNYRQIIIKLKEEFLKSEEEKSLLIVSNQSKPSQSIPSNENIITIQEMKQLQTQINNLKQGLQQAKEDLEKSKQLKEKSNKLRQLTLEENQRLENQLQLLQNQLNSHEEIKSKLKSDYEETKRKEIQLRERLKDYLDHDNVTNIQSKDLLIRIEQLQRENDLLKVQLTTIKSNQELYDDRNRIEMKEQDDISINVSSKGRILGRNEKETNEESKDELNSIRHQLHSKWENEKKLIKRVEILEKRLKEKIDENENLLISLKTLQEQNQLLELSKSSQSMNKRTESTKRTISMESNIKLDQLQTRINNLEDENLELRRQIDIDLTKEIQTLRHQLTTTKRQLTDTENELISLQDNKRPRSMNTSNEQTLRESESNYLKLESFKDEINQLKRIRIELESELIERDSQLLSKQCDLDIKDNQIKRYQKQIKDLESINPSSTKPNTKSITTNKDTHQSSEYELIIESMKTMIDKLKQENTILKQSKYRLNVSSPNKNDKHDERERDEQSPSLMKPSIPQSSSIISIDKKKYNQLMNENKILLEKSKQYDDISLKLTQKQQLLQQLRKQMKSKESEINQYQQQINNYRNENDSLKSIVNDQNNKIKELEYSIEQLTLRITDIHINQYETTQNQNIIIEMNRLKELLNDKQIEIDELNQQIINNSSNKFNYSALAKLEEENKKLKLELSAFDMEFFDEIENLKYEHAEAIRKLRIYRRKYGEIG